MTWVNGRQLESISAVNNGHAALSFTYDSDGLRLTKTVNGVEHKYIWLSGKLISEQYGSTTLEFFYDESGNPFAFSYNGTTYYYVTNLQGDIVKIVNANGVSQAEYRYNAWGELLSSSGALADINPLRYRSYYFDQETGFYYLKSRYYDPAICRFINADGLASTGQGFLGCNMFAYCGNNACNYEDPRGTKKEERYNKDIEDNEEFFIQCILLLIENENTPVLIKLIILIIDPSELIGTLGTYWELRKIIQGTGLQAHHLIEKRFLQVPEINAMYSSQYSMPSVILDPSTHGGYTLAWRGMFPYGSTDYGALTYADVLEFATILYSGGGGHDEWMEYVLH